MLAHFIHHVLTALTVPLLPFIRTEFALDYTQSGLVASAFTLSYGISQLPAGWLSDHVGPRILLTIGIVGVALAGFLIGISQTYLMMIIFLVLMGLVGGGYHPAASPLISMSVESKHRGRALGLHSIGGSASYFLAPLIGVAIASAWGWRGPFIGLSIPTIVFGIIFFLILGRRARKERKKQRTATTLAETPSTKNYMRLLVVFMFLSISTQALIRSIIAFIPLFMVDCLGVSEGPAAASIAIIYSSGIWAGPLGGYLSDRLGRVPVILAVSSVAGPIIFLLNIVSYGVGFIIVLITIGMIQTMRAPVTEAYIFGHASERNRSTILGIYFFTGMESGGVLTPLFGYLIDQLGFSLSITIASALVVGITITCSMFLRGTHD